MTGAAVDPYAKRQQRMTAARALRGVWHLVVETSRQLLRVEMVRAVIALLRYFWLAKVLGRMRVKQLDEQDAANIASNGLRSTIDHNMRVFDFSLHGFVSEVLPQFHVGRSDILIRPLSILDDVARRQHRKQVLSIGPRTEGEILNLIAHGFTRANITAVDLISYSPWIILGDMHDLPVEDDSMDVIIAGWVIGYSDNKPKVAEEIIRVGRHGAVVAVSGNYEHASDDSTPVSPTWGSQPITEPADFLRLFEGHVDTVFLSQDPKADGHGGKVLLIFRLNKR